MLVWLWNIISFSLLFKQANHREQSLIYNSLNVRVQGCRQEHQVLTTRELWLFQKLLQREVTADAGDDGAVWECSDRLQRTSRPSCNRLHPTLCLQAVPFSTMQAQICADRPAESSERTSGTQRPPSRNVLRQKLWQIIVSDMDTPQKWILFHLFLLPYWKNDAFFLTEVHSQYMSHFLFFKCSSHTLDHDWLPNLWCHKILTSAHSKLRFEVRTKWIMDTEEVTVSSDKLCTYAILQRWNVQVKLKLDIEIWVKETFK